MNEWTEQSAWKLQKTTNKRQKSSTCEKYFETPDEFLQNPLLFNDRKSVLLVVLSAFLLILSKIAKIMAKRLKIFTERSRDEKQTWINCKHKIQADCSNHIQYSFQLTVVLLVSNGYTGKEISLRSNTVVCDTYTIHKRIHKEVNILICHGNFSQRIRSICDFIYNCLCHPICFCIFASWNVMQ